ncbi:protein phosphatase CheZ [Noviherbaspirillum pedocola]|uniref:Protein phosphatase CheZ n=1 Tax=Noviherbaspirillum pedocola TaxID=2801341 RepID=A0A934W3P5_9BURK|nr:protein phosphatase CheZ [Noviherbaspirillum pedocola]MBK4737651.1 protein phosphatase CheZ [Noviherbaspirillum pedocola]
MSSHTSDDHTNSLASAEVDPKGSMYDRLGHIVRQLHDSLRELGYDRSLTAVVTEVADASDRLQYIATLTEKAANTVLNTVDEAMPVQEALIADACAIEKRWQKLEGGEGDVDAFKLLAADMRRFVRETGATAEAEKARLMRIMMAQDFQDITGQIIKKVVGITQKLERELAQLLADNAPRSGREHHKPMDLLAGPDVPAEAMAQNDVDDLLADLGF